MVAGGRLEIPLVATDPDGDRVTLSVRADSALPTGKLSGGKTLVFTPSPDQVGTYNFTLVASSGGKETTQPVTLTVTPDPITTTRISGVIQNTNQAPLAGVLIEIAGRQTLTAPDGSFELEFNAALPDNTLKVFGDRVHGDVVYPFIAEKLPLVLEHDVYNGVNNVISRPIYLPPIDLANAHIIDPTQNVVVTTTAIPSAAVTVAANSLKDRYGQPYTGQLSITEVPTNLTPAALPKNLVPDLVVTIQPGDMVFTTPAPLSLPNRTGYAPGTLMDLWSINPTTGLFDNVGTGQVSADGSVIETISGGIRNSSWHFFVPPADVSVDPLKDPRNKDNSCSECEAKVPATSVVELHSGALLETHELVSYQSLGNYRGLTLQYDSLRADPRPILHFGYDNAQSVLNQQLMAELTIRKGGFEYQVPGFEGGEYGLDGGEHFWSVPSGGGEIDAALQVDMRSMASGQYEYSLTTGLRLFTGSLFAGSSTTNSGKLLHVNSINSQFGSGWGLAGLQELVENEDGSILLINGDGSETLFKVSASSSDFYVSPPGDFSKLERLSNGTFRYTTKEQTIYSFNTLQTLALVQEPNGNKTQYIYNGIGQLTKIIDPASLETTFTYTGSKVSAITDPTGRVTQLKYDTSDNLVQITDPDGSIRTWSYDNDHHMTAEVDQRGYREESFYNEAGRATHSIRKDGSIVQFDPVQVQGLFSPQATIDPLNAPVALGLGAAKASYVDGNGNVVTTLLDQAGQAISSTDGAGFLPSIERDASNLVTKVTDGRGHITNYTYDAFGNLTSIADELAGNGQISSTLFPNPIGGSVTPLTDYAVGALPYSIATGDLDNDGNQDVVTANFSSNSVSVLFGNNDGTFAPQIDYAVGAGPTSVTLADFNHDGALEIFTANFQSNSVTQLLNLDGTFNFRADYRVGYTPISVALGDLNSDGNQDIVTANQYANGMSILYGNSYGSVSYGSDYPNQIGSQPLSVALGDLNSDGKIDIVTANGLGDDVTVLLGGGTGSFTRAFYTVGDTPASVKIGDLNNDGNLDLVTANQFASTVSILLGNGNGTFAAKTDFLVGATPTGVAVGDLNNDSKLDLVTSNANDNSVSILLGNGDGTFAPKSDFLVGNGPSSVVLGDLDNDSDLDFVTANFGANSVSSRLNSTIQLNVVIGLGKRSYTYDPVFNQITSEMNELGRQTLYEIDPNNGNLLSTTQVVGAVGGSDDVITRYTYTPNGLVDLLTDPLGRVTDYDYDAIGRLIKTTFAQGTAEEAAQQFEYDLAGNIIAMIDENGERTEYSYDAMNQLVEIIEADPDGEDPLTSPVTTFTYDAAGNKIATTDALFNTTEYSYDAKDRLTAVVDAFDGEIHYSYDFDGNLIKVTDQLGRDTQIHYDSRHRRTEIIDPLGGITKFRYDFDNNLISEIDPLGNRTNFTYDARGRLVKETDPLGKVMVKNYDAANNLVATINQNGQKTQFAYDELNRIQQQTDAKDGISTFTYDLVGNILATTDELNRTTSYSYDNRDRLTSVTDPLNGVTKYVMDAVGNLLSVTDSLNRTTHYGYDALSRRIEVTDPLNHTTAYVMDAVGNLTEIRDTQGRTTKYNYDVLNRRTTTINAVGDSATTTYDAVGNITAVTDELGRTTQFMYDPRNLQTAVINPLGNKTNTTYDANGNVVEISSPLGQTTRYKYDANNRKIAVIDAVGSTTTTTYDAVGNVLSISDPVNNTTTYTYDELNRQLTDTNVLGLARTFTYDAVGNRIAMRDRNGRESKFTYDAKDRQTSEQWLDGSNNPIRYADYTYDAASQLTSASDPDSAYSYAYDLNGRLTSVDNAGTNGVPNVRFNYSYDAVNNLLSVTDTINGTELGTEAFTYDLLNRVKSITQSGNGVSNKRVDMAYDKASFLTSLTRYADNAGTQLVADSSYTYDNAGRLTQLHHSRNGTTFANYNWTYDALDRITSLTSPDGTSNYNYDATDQLTSTDHSYQGDEAYSYDGNGNRTNTGYTTGSNNRLLSDGTYNYEYDAEGNRTLRTEIATGIVTQYTWDYRNRLTRVVESDASGNVLTEANYTYDVDNRRIAKTVDPDGAGSSSATVERFVYDGDHIALTFDGNGNQTHRYLHGTQIDQILADENATGEVLWALTDNLGTVRDLIDSTGTIQNHITYDSFGNVTSETNPAIDFRFGYTGRELDAETGLSYYRARYYDSFTGQFISSDPIGFAAGDANLYRYVGNKPLNAIDPFGLASTNLTKLLTVACAGSSGNTCDKYPPAQHYSQALATARIWFYAITTSSVGAVNIKRRAIPRPSPSTHPRWVLVLPLKDDTPSYHFGYRGKATLRPGGDSGGFPTIDLTPDDKKERHETPGYQNIKEIKFLYKDKENKDPKPPCPHIIPNKNDKEAIDRIINHNIHHPQKRPGGEPVPAPVRKLNPRRTPDSKQSPWWPILPTIPRIPIPEFLNPWRQTI